MPTLFPSALLILCISGVAQQTSNVADCTTLQYLQRETASLCGTADICSGDICGSPSFYDFDEHFDVVLRDSKGRELETKSLSYKESAFCFSGRENGNYQLAFVLRKNGVPEPARVFPTRYKHNPQKPNDAVYMIEVTCPKSSQ